MPGQPPDIRRTLLGNSAFIFLIRLCPALAGMIVILICANRMPPGFYGFYQGFWVRFQLYSALATLGLPALLLTYPTRDIRQFASQLTPKHYWMAGAWLLCAGLVFNYNLLTAYAPLRGWFPVLFLAVNVLIALCEACLMTAQRFKLIALCSIGYAAFFLTAHFMFLDGSLGFVLLLLCLLAAGSLRLIVLAVYAIRMLRRAGHDAMHTANRTGVRSLWFHLGLYDVLQTVFRWADKFILTFFLSHELLAVYVNGTVDIPVLPLLLGAVGSAMLIELNTHQADDKHRIILLRQSGKQLATVVFPIFCYLILFRHELFETVFRGKYPSAVPLFLISCLVIPLRAYNFTSILQFKGKGRIINAGAVLDLVLAIVLMYPLYLLLGLSGIALAFVISTYVQAGFYLWQTARLLRCRIGALLPLASWSATAFVSLSIFLIARFVLAHYFNSLMALILGTGLLTLLIAFNTGRQLISKKQS